MPRLPSRISLHQQCIWSAAPFAILYLFSVLIIWVYVHMVNLFFVSIILYVHNIKWISRSLVDTVSFSNHEYTLYLSCICMFHVYICIKIYTHDLYIWCISIMLISIFMCELYLAIYMYEKKCSQTCWSSKYIHTLIYIHICKTQ